MPSLAAVTTNWPRTALVAGLLATKATSVTPACDATVAETRKRPASMAPEAGAVISTPLPPSGKAAPGRRQMPPLQSSSARPQSESTTHTPSSLGVQAAASRAARMVFRKLISLGLRLCAEAAHRVQGFLRYINRRKRFAEFPDGCDLLAGKAGVPGVVRVAVVEPGAGPVAGSGGRGRGVGDEGEDVPDAVAEVEDAVSAQGALGRDAGEGRGWAGGARPLEGPDLGARGGIEGNDFLIGGVGEEGRSPAECRRRDASHAGCRELRRRRRGRAVREVMEEQSGRAQENELAADE